MSDYYLSQSAKLTPQIVIWSCAVLLFIAIVVAGWSCVGHGTVAANVPPITHLANVPPPQDTITTKNPQLSLYWWANDPDGQVVAFQYRWSYPINGVVQYRPWSTILNFVGLLKVGGAGSLILMLDTADYARRNGPSAYNGQQSQNYAPALYRYFNNLVIAQDSATLRDLAVRFGEGDTVTVQGVRMFASNSDKQPFPVHVNPNSGAFIFDSQDSLNFHTFEVRAVDNLGAVGASAKLSFNTPRVQMPHTLIGRISTDTLVVLDSLTDTFLGLPFTFSSVDPNSPLVKQYSWNVDSLNTDGTVHSTNPAGTLKWSDWTQDTTVYLAANDFDPRRKFEPELVLCVWSWDGFGAIDTAGFFGDIITTLGTNNPQDRTNLVVVHLDYDGIVRPVAGTYPLSVSAGTTPGTMKITYNNNFSAAVDNVAPLTSNIVLHGGIAGKLTVSAQLAPNVLPSADTVGVTVASAKFYTVYPLFARDTKYRRFLVLNNSYHWASGSPSRPSADMIKSFYTSILHDSLSLPDSVYNSQVDFWDAQMEDPNTNSTGWPSQRDFVKYSLVFIVADTDLDTVNFGSQGQPLSYYGYPNGSYYSFLTDRVSLLKTYLSVGGKAVFSGTNCLGSNNMTQKIADFIHVNTNPGSILYGELHTDFAGAAADSTIPNPYPDAVLDPAKADTSTCHVPTLDHIWAVQPKTLGEHIYHYISSRCDTSKFDPVYAPYPSWTVFDGQVVGTRYLGPTYQVVYYGFPLYYCQNAAEIVRYTLTDIYRH